MPVVLIAVTKDKKVYLHRRQKRPFQNKLSLPGGRVLVGESPKDAALRILKTKYRIIAKFKKINSISLEKVEKKGKLMHSFLLIFCTAETKDKINYQPIKSNKSKIIPSDYTLLEKDLDKEINVETLITKV